MTANSRSRSKLADVARAAGVGNATVSRALNGGKNVSEETQRKIAAAIRDLNYQPNRIAQSLKGSSSGMIGMIVPSISDAFFSRCAEAVESISQEHGALVVVVPSHEKDATIIAGLHQLLRYNIDGIILANSTHHSLELATELRQISVPIVGIDGPLADVGRPSVLCENFAGAYSATEHLLEHGYHTVVSVQVKPDLYTMRERLRGYRAAMLHAKADAREEIIETREEAMSVLTRHMRGQKHPIALFAGNNLTARYICEAVRVLNLQIPQQVALLSFDDFDLADTLSPAMSVVQQPTDEMGHSAAHLLFELMARKPGNTMEPIPTLTLNPHLVLRESCGCHYQTSSTEVLRRKVKLPNAKC